MSIVTARTLLEGRLNAITPSLSTAWENVLFTPVANTPYQRVNLLVSDIKNPCINDKMYETTGFLQVMLCYPLATGAKNAYARAEMIQDSFCFGLQLTSGAVKVLIHKTPQIAPAIINGDRYEIPVSIYFAVAKYPS